MGYTTYASGSNVANHNLPSAYTEVEYIKSSGFDYIDTGVIADANTTASIDFQVTEKKYGFEYIPIGLLYDDSNGKYFFAAGINDNNTYWNQSSCVTYSQTSSITARTVATVTPPSGYTNNAANKTIYLFVRNGTDGVRGIYGKIKIYSCKIYDDGTLIRDFIPCFRKSDNEPGLYDLVNNIFYTRENIIPSEYQHVEYIESTGTQYINLGYAPFTNMGWYIKFTIYNEVASSGHGSIFGEMDSSSLRYYLETWTNDSKKGSFNYIGTLYDALITKGELQELGFSKSNNTFVRTDNTYVSVTAKTLSNTKSMYLFCYNNENTPTNLSNTKVYRFILFNNFSIVHDYIPVVRVADDKPGLYDRVTDNFLINSGDDEFTYGDPVTSYLETGDVIYASVAHEISKVYAGIEGTNTIFEDLPTEYTQVEYIQSDPYGYIPTNYLPTVDSSYDGVFSNGTIPADAHGFNIFGVNYSESTTSTPNCWMNAANGKLCYYWDGAGWGGKSFTLNGEKFRFIYTKSTISFGIGTSMTTELISSNEARSTMESSYPIYILGVNDIGNDSVWHTDASLRIHSFKIYESSTLVRNFVPCFRKSDQQIGLYDTETEDFFPYCSDADPAIDYVYGPVVYSSAAKHVVKVYAGDSEGIARIVHNDSKFYEIDGILDSQIVGAYDFKNAATAAEALTDLSGHGKTLSNSGCSWSAGNGYYISNSNYLDNSSVRSAAKSLVMKIWGTWGGNYHAITGNWAGLSLWLKTPFETASFSFHYQDTGIGHDKNGTSTNYTSGGSLNPAALRLMSGELSACVAGVSSGGWGTLYRNGSAVSMRNATATSGSYQGNWTRWQKGQINIPRLVGGTGSVNSVTMNGHFYITYLIVFNIDLSAALQNAVYQKWSEL